MIVVVVVVLQPSLLVLDYWEEHLGGNGKNKRRKIPSFFFCRTQLSFWPSSKDRRKMSLINPIAKTRYPITQYFPFWPVRWSFEIDARLCLETTPKGYFFFTDSMAYGCALLYSTSPQATFFLLLLRIRLYDNEGRPAASSFHHQPVYWLQLKREASIYHSGRWGERKFTNELEGEREKANGKRNEDPRCRCLAWFRYSFLPFSPFLCIFSFTCTYFVARLIWSVLHGGKSCHLVIDTNDALDRYFPQKKKGTCRYGIISSGKYCVIHDYNTVTGRGWVVMEEDVDEEMWPNFASILQVTWCSAEPTRRTHSSTMDGYRPRTVLRYERGGGTKRWNSVSQLSLPCVVWWESTTWCSQNRQ